MGMYKVKATYLPRENMRFDLDYYFKTHVPLAKENSSDKLNIVRIDVESEAELLLDPDTKCTPCVFSIYFNNKEDVETFRNVMRSSAIEPMRKDVEQYTNCEIEWTVCEVQEV